MSKPPYARKNPFFQPQKTRKTLSISLIIACVLMVTITAGCARTQDPSKRPSPLVSDSFFSDSLQISVSYSSPRVRDREIWGELVPYGKIWRMGANEATILNTNQDLIIQGQRLPKGKYGVFSIPEADQWTIIFNKEWDQWGAYSYQASKDQMRIQVRPDTTFDFLEEMTFQLKPDTIEFRWENLGISIPYRAAE